MRPSLDAFDIMAARPGLRRFVFEENGVELEAMGTLGLARALAAKGHDVICPIKRDRDRAKARHNRQAEPIFRDTALWPSYLIVRWRAAHTGMVELDWHLSNWFKTRTLAWGQTAGIRWTLPSAIAENYRNVVVDLVNPPARFGVGQTAVVATGLHRGQSLKILASRRNKDGSWTYQAEPPPYLRLCGKSPQYWIAEDFLAANSDCKAQDVVS
jgi:hypothetical protein